MLLYLLYNLALFLLLVVLSPVWLILLINVPKTRAGFWEKLGWFSPEVNHKLQGTLLKNRVWVHAVSVGELNAARPLVEALLRQKYVVLLSTTTATGHELAQRLYPQLPVFYFPFDLPNVMAYVIHRVSPATILILETEIWPNLLFLAARRNIPVILANGRLTEKSFQRYIRFQWFFRWVLQHFSAILMQSAEDAERMRMLGAPRPKVHMTGNLKFDLPTLDKAALQNKLAQELRFPEGVPVVVFASTHKGEDELFLDMLDALKKDFPDIKAVLAPRHPERIPQLIALLTGRHAHFTLRSQLPYTQLQAPSPLILLDTIGELMAVFTLGTVAVMGGSFVPWGGHNPLEPIHAGIPVIFGPHMHHFKDIANKILKAEAGFQVNAPGEVVPLIRQLLTDSVFYQQRVENGKQLMQANSGAVETILQHVRTYVTPPG